mmetsp:Transcript_4296/g.7147  ORF Transcript_4296/g.7147 Transcript_4296/m.7147 type:complete len:341 (-) Transcript_4296:90-1112(-)
MASRAFASGICLACLGAAVNAANTRAPLSTKSSQTPPGALPGTVQTVPGALPGTYGFLSKSNSDIRDATSNILGIQGGLDEMNAALREEYGHWLFRRKTLEAEHDHLHYAIIDAQAALEKQQHLRLELQQQEDTYSWKKNDNDKVAMRLQEVHLERDSQNKRMESEIKDLECELAAIPSRRQQQLTLEYNLISQLGDEKSQLQQDILSLNKKVMDQKANASTLAMNGKQEISDLLKDIETVQSRINSLEMEVMAQAQGQMEVQRVQHQVEAQINETSKQRQKVLTSAAECKSKKSQQDTAIQAAKQSFVAANQKFQECQKLDATNQELQGQLTQCTASQR